MSLQPVILAGGHGTRLWPVSREAYPKQFIALQGSRTMFQQTVERLEGLEAEPKQRATGIGEPIVLCNEAHRFLAAEQLRQLGRDGGGIILEPEGRNTAPALTLAAHMATREGSDPVLLAMPSDHVIADADGFRRTVERGFECAANGLLVTFGVVATAPESGYGYIRAGQALRSGAGQPRRVVGFEEKPDVDTARAFVTSGDYFWNSGIFMMRASVWLRLIEQFRPDIAKICSRAFAEAEVDRDFCRPSPTVFRDCPADSIDYAVMERLTDAAGDAADAADAVVLALDVGWSDAGSWSALWEISRKDERGNVIEGDVVLEGATDTLALAQHRLLTAVGVRNLVIIETPDAVLVADKDRAQDVKRIADWLKREQRTEFRYHRRVHRPWGSYEGLFQGERFQVKRLEINPYASLSLQMHHHRAEHWVVVSGTARVTRDEDEFLLGENESTFIPLGSRHRLENPGKIPLVLIEVQSGAYLGEDDIVRFADVYNRQATE